MRRNPEPNAARVEASPKEVRDYWRSMMITSLMTHAANAQLVDAGERDIRRLPERMFDPAIHKARELLDWACEQEKAFGRVPSIARHVNEQLLALTEKFRPTPAGLQQPAQPQLEFETRSQS